jgi:hypothetical protein
MLMLIMLRSIVGLSVMRQPLPQKLNRRNGTQIDLGAWMKRISKVKGKWVYLSRLSQRLLLFE